MMMDDSKKNEFVSLFPKNRKSTICNKILEPIRAGNDDLYVIADETYDKLGRFPDSNGDLMEIIRDNNELYLDAIRYYIKYEKMSHEDKQKLKQANSKQYVDQYMDKQPITENQIWKLNQLNYMGSLDLTKLGACQKISELTNE